MSTIALAGTILLANQLTIMRNLTLVSYSNTDVAVLSRRANDTHSVGRVLNVTDGAKVSLRSLHITGGGGVEFGGGINVEQGSDLDMLACVVSHSSASLWGGGLFADGGGVLRVTDCTFTANHCGEYGGGVYVELMGAVAFSGCKIIGNTADHYAGGIMIEYVPRCTFDDCVISDNVLTADWGGEGGGLYLYRSVAEMTRCTFANNRAARGGAAYLTDYAFNLSDVNFIHNHASNIGSSLYITVKLEKERSRFSNVSFLAVPYASADHVEVSGATLFAGAWGSVWTCPLGRWMPPDTILHGSFVPCSYPDAASGLCKAGYFGDTSSEYEETCSGICPAGVYCPAGSAEPIACPSDAVMPMRAAGAIADCYNPTECEFDGAGWDIAARLRSASLAETLAVLVGIAVLIMSVAVVAYKKSPNYQDKPLRVAQHAMLATLSCMDLLTDIAFLLQIAYYGFACGAAERETVWLARWLLVADAGAIGICALGGLAAIIWILRVEGDQLRISQLGKLSAPLILFISLAHLDVLKLLPWRHAPFDGLPSSRVVRIAYAQYAFEVVAQVSVAIVFLINIDSSSSTAVISLVISLTMLVYKTLRVALALLFGDAALRDRIATWAGNVSMNKGASTFMLEHKFSSGGSRINLRRVRSRGPSGTIPPHLSVRRQLTHSQLEVANLKVEVSDLREQLAHSRAECDELRCRLRAGSPADAAKGGAACSAAPSPCKGSFDPGPSKALALRQAPAGLTETSTKVRRISTPRFSTLGWMGPRKVESDGLDESSAASSGSKSARSRATTPPSLNASTAI